MSTKARNGKKREVTGVAKPKRKYVAVKRMRFTQDLADELCAYISRGMSLRTAVKQPGMPSAVSVYNWFNLHPQFVKQYARAKDDSADALADDIQQIADDVLSGKVDPKVGKVAGELKQWSASKLKPKKYGEHLDLTSGGEALPTPNIYIPKELSYRSVQDIQEGETLPGLPG